MAYERITKRSRTSRMNVYKKESKGKSERYKLGLAMGLIVGSEGKERTFLQKKLNKYKNLD